MLLKEGVELVHIKDQTSYEEMVHSVLEEGGLTGENKCTLRIEYSVEDGR